MFIFYILQTSGSDRVYCQDFLFEYSHGKCNSK